SDTFHTSPRYTLKVNNVAQEGDKFRVDYTVTNTGNAPAPEGTKVGINLTGLYGDLDSERYGNIENSELYSADLNLGTKTAEPNTKYISSEEGTEERIASTVHNTEFSESVLVDIPPSVFKFCGYDAVQLVINDKDGNVTQESNQCFVALGEPVNLRMNNGEPVSISGSETKKVDLSYDSTVFMNESKVVYSVADPAVASVTENGEVKGIKNGETELIATLLPSGKSTSVALNVSGIKQDGYTVTFNANGGSGEMDNQKFETGSTAALADNKFTNNGYRFTGWNTEADGSGTSYTNGQKITPEEDITLYAVWTKKSSGGGGGNSSGSSGSKVSIYNSGNSTNGKVNVSNTNPSKGETVSLTVTPDEGYEVDKLIVTDSNGNEIEVKRNDDGTFSFVQPNDNNVTVKAEFKKKDAAEQGNGGNSGSEGGKERWFKDVPDSTWYYAPIKEAFDNSRMSGMSDDYFEPETDITRGMFAYAIYRREGLPETDAQNKFEDVKADTYYEKAIAWATENGIVAGIDDTHYAPDDQITREQMAAILYRYAQFKDYDVSVGEDTNILDFTDAQDISSYAVQAIQWAVGDSVITGFEDGTMRPKANANRAQMAVILNKIADLF
ncbi:MAG: S-layer homology domain-containing protein, partial [Clostridia bacterium]|nr:S-layer homology domain-containing protein [Clostridia bacterium]